MPRAGGADGDFDDLAAEPWTERSAQHSSDGIRGWRTTTPIKPARRRSRDPPPLPHGPICRFLSNDHVKRAVR